MKLWVVRNKDSGEELAVHGEMGETLLRWIEDLRSQGYEITVAREEIPDE